MSSSNKVQLYGGAIEVHLPECFKDVSAIREVPDSQEVYLDQDGYTSVIFDILEHVGESDAKDDAEALNFHFGVITEEAGELPTVENVVSEARLAKMPNTKARSLLGTVRSAQGGRPRRANESDWTAIVLTLIRLPEKGTDIVVTVNIPHVPGFHPDDVTTGGEKFGEFVKGGLDLMQQVLATFEIKDWGLFVDE